MSAKLGFACAGLLLVSLTALGCQGPAYVSPDTVALVITKDSTSVERVHECRYIPVLLGSRNRKTFAVEGDLRATLDLTRDEVVVLFEGAGTAVDAFSFPSSHFSDGTQETDSAPPSGYTVKLLGPCTPDDD